MSLSPQNPERPKLPRRIKIMIVDDSAVIRGIIEKILSSNPDIEVCGFSSNGEEALRAINICRPDIVILDIEMPVMDGITALPLLLEKNRDLKILICSTLSDRGAEISLKALSLGAADCILKPSGASAIEKNSEFSLSLLRSVLFIGSEVLKKDEPKTPVKTQKFAPRSSPRILAVGSSTGGPNALTAVLRDLKGLQVPIVITQHMPEKFTKVLAEQINKSTGMDCKEAEDGEILMPGRAYIAPGGFHMVFKKTGHDVLVHLDKGPLENFCRPSVDPMLRSLNVIYGAGVFSVILTGMGQDGLAGCREVVKSGGQVIAQDAATSVVWGMPGAVANDGLCSAVLPLKDIAPYVLGAFSSALRTPDRETKG